MKTTDTPPPLAQRITPGPYKQGTRGPDACPIIGTVKGTMVCKLAHSTHHEDQADQAEANAVMILEAFQTTASTGRTPRQLADFCRDLIDHLNYTGWGDSWERSCSTALQAQADEFINRITP